MTKLKKYWLLSLIIILAVSFYPLYMGFCVVSDMIKEGTVLSENYPKYIIPYTPICLSVIIAVILMPVFLKYAKKLALLLASTVSLGMFFLSELLLESKVIVTTTVKTTLESWQMYMCYVPPEGHETRTWKAIDVLIGDYNPAFKMHFYIISVIIIITLLNCFYGFAQMILSKDKRRLNALLIQAICSVLFLGLCILACFTAFFRDGEINVSVISALLMSLFFILFGVTAGSYIGSFMLGKRKILSVILPAAVSSFITFFMYIGEMILLSGHLYRYGNGLMFNGIPGIILAPVDIIIIILSGCISAAICLRLNKTLKYTITE